MTTIHRAGHRILIGFWAATFVVAYFCLLAGLVLAAVGLLMLWFFRIPPRPIYANSAEVTAVSDGKVVLIEEVFEDEHFGARVQKVSVFLSIFNVHAQWSPVAGRLAAFKYHPGKYLVAWHPKSSTLNERSTFVVDVPPSKDSAGGTVLFRQVAGAVARRLRWYVQPGDQLTQGQEVGFILFGSRIDFYLPLDASIQVEVGQKVVARSTVIARLA
jgi:phosphatidylserine decarboxylase